MFVSYRYLQDNRTLFLGISFILMGLGLLITGVFICRSSKLQEYKSESKKSLIYVLGWKLLIVLACLIYLVNINFLEASGGNFGIIEKILYAKQLWIKQKRKTHLFPPMISF